MTVIPDDANQTCADGFNQTNGMYSGVEETDDIGSKEKGSSGQIWCYMEVSCSYSLMMGVSSCTYNTNVGIYYPVDKYHEYGEDCLPAT